MKKPPVIPDIPEQDQTPTVMAEQFAQQIQLQTEEIARLKDEINILKGGKKRPVFKPSKLDKQTDKQKNSDQDSSKPSKKKRVKKSKTAQLKIHEDKVIKTDTPIPEGSRFKVHRDFVVQDLHIDVHNIRYRLERFLRIIKSIRPRNQSQSWLFQLTDLMTSMKKPDNPLFN